MYGCLVCKCEQGDAIEEDYWFYIYWVTPTYLYVIIVKLGRDTVVVAFYH